jgi:hypothetical protein
VLGYLTHIIAHETGHMIAGLITGWKFVSMQIFHILITKKQTYQIKIIPAFGCQCIMSPKSIEQGSYLYTLGGILMNLLITSISLYRIIILPVGILSWLLSFCFFACGISIVLINGIPNTKKVCNDMACFLLCIRDKETRYHHNIQLMIAQRLSEGKNYCQCDLLFNRMRLRKATNDILAYQAVIEFYNYLDHDLYLDAGKSLDKIELNQSVSCGVRNIIMMEALYYDLFMGILHKDILVLNKSSYNHDIDCYIKNYDTRGDVHAIRVKAILVAYKHYKDGDIKEGIYSLEKALIETQGMKCLYSGEKIFCMDQLMGIRNILYRDSLMLE